MSIDYLTCVCGDNHSECEPLEYCSFCEQVIFECCYDEQAKKYGVVGPDDVDPLGRKCIDQYGSHALKRCDNCIDVRDVQPMNVKVRNSTEGDWVELWINGEEKLADHRLRPIEILEALQKAGLQFEITQEDFEP